MPESTVPHQRSEPNARQESTSFIIATTREPNNVPSGDSRCWRRSVVGVAPRRPRTHATTHLVGRSELLRGELGNGDPEQLRGAHHVHLRRPELLDVLEPQGGVVRDTVALVAGGNAAAPAGWADIGGTVATAGARGVRARSWHRFGVRRLPPLPTESLGSHSQCRRWVGAHSAVGPLVAVDSPRQTPTARRSMRCTQRAPTWYSRRTGRCTTYAVPVPLPGYAANGALTARRHTPRGERNAKARGPPGSACRQTPGPTCPQSITMPQRYPGSSTQASRGCHRHHSVTVPTSWVGEGPPRRSPAPRRRKGLRVAAAHVPV